MLDISADYLIFDNPIAVTLKSAMAVGASTISVSTVTKHQVSIREANASGGVYTSEDVVFNVPQDLLLSGSTQLFTPKPADKVIDDEGTTFTVLAVDRAAFRTRWRLTCRDLATANSLKDSVYIYRPDGATDAAGNREPTFQPIALNVRGRLQETGATVQDRHGKRLTVRTYSLWLEDQVAVTNEDIVLHGGRIFQITNSFESDRIDVLQRIECEWTGGYALDRQFPGAPLQQGLTPTGSGLTFIDIGDG